MGLVGLASDVQTVSSLLRFRLNLCVGVGGGGTPPHAPCERCCVARAHPASYSPPTAPHLAPFPRRRYALREERAMAPRTFGHLVSHILYEKRFAPYFIEPVVAGLAADGTPFITATDLIGAAVTTDDFVVAGTCSENLYGMCESLYRKDMSPDELFEVASQALLSAVDRDAVSGWGAQVKIITLDGVTTRELKARMD